MASEATGPQCRCAWLPARTAYQSARIADMKRRIAGRSAVCERAYRQAGIVWVVYGPSHPRTEAACKVWKDAETKMHKAQWELLEFLNANGVSDVD